MITKLNEYISLWQLEIGEYVLIQKMYAFKPDIFLKGKIISLNKEFGVDFPIKVKTEDGDIDTYQPSNIKRRLTPEEIEEYKVKEETWKFNL